jgi:hypothetical protein
MDDIAQASLAVVHAHVAVLIGAMWPADSGLGIALGAAIAYGLVFYE